MKKIIISLSLLIGLGAHMAHGTEQLKQEAKRWSAGSKLAAAFAVVAAGYWAWTRFRTSAVAPKDAKPDAETTTTPGKLAPEKTDLESQGDTKSAAAEGGDAKRADKKRKLAPTKKIGATIGATINKAIAPYMQNHTHLYTYYSKLNDSGSLGIWHANNTHRFSIQRGEQHFSIQALPVAQMIIDDPSEQSSDQSPVGTDIVTNKPTLQACYTDIGQIRLIVTAHKKNVQVLLFKKNA